MSSKKIHTYAASFGDDLAQGLIVENTRLNDYVLDPFNGSSTTLVQAKELGRSAIAIDVDPIACLIARVVTEKYTLDELQEFSFQNDNLIDEARLAAMNILNRESVLRAGSNININGFQTTVPNNPSIDYWFSPIQMAVLVALTNIAGKVENQKLHEILLLTISSAIVHKWPNTISLAKDIDHSRPHYVYRSDVSIESQLRIFKRCFSNTLNRLRDIINNTVNDETHFQVIEKDVLDALILLERDSIDYVLTSPPYFNAIDYPRAHKFSEWWLWPERQPLKNNLYIGLKPGGKENGISNNDLVNRLIPQNIDKIIPLKDSSAALFRKFCVYVIDMNSVIYDLKKVMKNNAKMGLVIANNILKDIKLRVVDIWIKLLNNTGLEEISSEERFIQENRGGIPMEFGDSQGL